MDDSLWVLSSNKVPREKKNRVQSVRPRSAEHRRSGLLRAAAAAARPPAGNGGVLGRARLPPAGRLYDRGNVDRCRCGLGGRSLCARDLEVGLSCRLPPPAPPPAAPPARRHASGRPRQPPLPLPTFCPARRLARSALFTVSLLATLQPAPSLPSRLQSHPPCQVHHPRPAAPRACRPGGHQGVHSPRCSPLLCFLF